MHGIARFTFVLFAGLATAGSLAADDKAPAAAPSLLDWPPHTLQGSIFCTAIFGILGIVLALVGFFFMLVPGPGLLIAVPGLALVAGESLTVAKMLDWLEKTLRPLFEKAKSRWDKAKSLTKIALASLAVLLGGAGLVAGYYLFYR